MRELGTEQDVHQAERTLTAERGPSYRLVQDESLPPLGELIREHRAMVEERLREEREQDHHFSHTLHEWSKRERGVSKK
jgi:hypothetical protein